MQVCLLDMRPPRQTRLLDFLLQRPFFLLLVVLTLHVLSLPSWSLLLQRHFCFQHCCLQSPHLSKDAVSTGVAARWNIASPHRLLDKFTAPKLSCGNVYERQGLKNFLFPWLESNSGVSFFSFGISSRRNANDIPKNFSSIMAPTVGQGTQRGPASPGRKKNFAAGEIEAGTTRGHPSPIRRRGAPAAANVESAAVHRGPSKRPDPSKSSSTYQQNETPVSIIFHVCVASCTLCF